MIFNIPTVYWKGKFGKPLLSIFQVVPLSSLYQVKWDIIKSSEHVSTASTLQDLDPSMWKTKEQMNTLTWFYEKMIWKDKYW